MNPAILEALERALGNANPPDQGPALNGVPQGPQMALPKGPQLDPTTLMALLARMGGNRGVNPFGQ